jgi:hypothetical protein
LEGGKLEQCTICMSGAVANCTLPCDHRFCEECIVRLDTCPIDRKPVTCRRKLCEQCGAHSASCVLQPCGHEVCICCLPEDDNICPVDKLTYTGSRVLTTDESSKGLVRR